MENLNNLLLDYTAPGSPEEKVLLAKVLVHIKDYIQAIRHFGEGFMAIQLNMKHPFSGGMIQQAFDAGTSKAIDRTRILYNGKLAYIYLFGEDNGNAIGFIPVCEALGLNARIFRHRLRGMTKEQADEIFIHCFIGEKKKNDN